MKLPQMNKNRWSHDEERNLWSGGKDKKSVVEIVETAQAINPKRNEKAVKNKLYHMGFSIKAGAVL